MVTSTSGTDSGGASSPAVGSSGVAAAVVVVASPVALGAGDVGGAVEPVGWGGGVDDVEVVDVDGAASVVVVSCARAGEVRTPAVRHAAVNAATNHPGCRAL